MHRYAQVNNKYMGEEFDPSQLSHILIYIGANKLYGWDMSQKLPTGGFRFVEPSEFDSERISQLAEDARKGYLLEVDMLYPRDLPGSHNDLSFMLERILTME